MRRAVLLRGPPQVARVQDEGGLLPPVQDQTSAGGEYTQITLHPVYRGQRGFQTSLSKNLLKIAYSFYLWRKPAPQVKQPPFGLLGLLLLHLAFAGIGRDDGIWEYFVKIRVLAI